MIAIDQHAAHERIGFEKLKSQMAVSHIEQQHMLIPEQVELAAKEAACIEEHRDTLAALGLAVEPFGGSTFIIKSVPSLLNGADVKSLVIKIARDLADIGKSSSLEELVEHILKVMACHKQVRSGDKLSDMEMRTLLTQMDQWPNTNYCPHGRPTCKKFSADEIKKWFNRA